MDLNGRTNSNKMLSRKKGISTQIFRVEINENDHANIIIIFNKPQKTHEEILGIVEYLMTFQDVVSMIKIVTQDVKQLLFYIGYRIKAEYTEENRIVCKYGDKSETFYIILKGSVSVVGPREISVKASEYEYLDYLLRLRQLDEFEIISKTINANIKIFPIKDKDFEAWLKNPEINQLQITDNRSLESELYRKYNYKVETKCINVEEYIERRKIHSLSYSGEKKAITLYYYFHIVDLPEKSKFGHLGLQSISQKRTATIITKSSCIFGILKKNIFDEALKDATDKLKKACMTFITNTQLFYGVDIYYIKQNYNNFIFETVKKGTKIIEEGTEVKYIYCIRNGDFESSTTCNILNLENKIKSFGGIIIRKDNDDDIDQSYNRKKLINFINKKFTFKIIISTIGDFLGLSDIEDNKFCFNVECVSVTGEYFRIEKEVFENIIKCSQFNHIRKEIIQKKRVNLKEKLELLRKSKLEHFYLFNNNSIITDSPQTKEKKQLYKSLHLTTKKENLKIKRNDQRIDYLNINYSLIKSERDSSKVFEISYHNPTTYSNSSDIITHKNNDEQLIYKKIALQTKLTKPYKIQKLRIKDGFLSNPTSIAFKDIVKLKTNDNETKKSQFVKKIPYLNYSTEQQNFNSHSKDKMTRSVIAHSQGSLEKRSNQRTIMESKNDKGGINSKLITWGKQNEQKTIPKLKSTFSKYVDCIKPDTLRRDNNNSLNYFKVNTSEIINFKGKRKIKDSFSKSLYNTKFAQNLSTHIFKENVTSLNNKR